MKTYKIYVDGMYVGTEDFTISEVTAIESDQDIKLIEKQKAEAINMIQPKRSSERPSKMATCQLMMASRTNIERLKRWKL